MLEIATLLAEEALSEGLFDRFLGMVARDFPGSSAVLDYDAREERTEFAGWEVDTSAKRAYSDHFHAVNPFREAILAHHLYNSTFIGSRWVDQRRLLRTEFYNDWMRPRGDRYFIVLSIGFPDGGRTGIPIYRAQAEGDDYTAEDVRRLDMLRPFLQNTILLRRLYRQHQSYPSTRVDAERLRLPVVRAEGGRRDACNDAGELHVKVAHDPNREQRIALNPLSSRAAIVVPRADWNPQAIFVRRYGLSKREGEVAALLADGLSYAEIAGRLGISAHTVNSHVKSLLRKLNLSSTRRLAALLYAAR